MLLAAAPLAIAAALCLAELGGRFDASGGPVEYLDAVFGSGAVAIWDNRATQHYPVADYPVADYWPARRRMDRVTISEDRSYGASQPLDQTG